MPRFLYRRGKYVLMFIAACLLFSRLLNFGEIREQMPSSVTRAALLSEAVKEENLCQYYHIALIVATADEARKASYALKSLLYHRRSPLHLHFLVSSLTHRIMKTLLETWELDQVRFDFYEATALTSNKSSAFTWEVMKFRLPDFLPPEFRHDIVYISNDVCLLDDVSVLWKQPAGNATVGQHIGLINTGSCGNPALPNGCFSDKLAVFHLETFRKSTLRLELLGAKSKSQVDAILAANHNKDIFSLPCHWGIPLDAHQINCTLSHSQIKGVILHRTETSFVNNAFVERAREHLMTVLGSEPPVNKPLDCYITPTATVNAFDEVEDRCSRYRHAAQMKRRTHLYFLGQGDALDMDGHNGSDPFAITLLTQLTMDRFGALERMMRNWEGPAAVVFHLNDAEAVELERKVQESPILHNRKSVTYHVVYKRQTYNPINYLRNVAVNNSRSPYLLFVDADLIPNPSLYNGLKVLTKKYMTAQNSSTLLVVPAFQMFSDLGEATPKKKADLLKLLPNKTVVGYGMERSWNLGHKPTNYNHWVSAKEPYQAHFADAYEPYLLIRREMDARYNELLLERMGDKIAYIRLLHGQGFNFLVIPNDFLIHVPHPVSSGSMRFRNEPHYQHCSSRFFEAYRKELYDRFPGRKF